MRSPPREPAPPGRGDSEACHVADLELVAAARAGDRAARREFVRRMRCVPRILAALNRRLQVRLGADDLEDVVQEAVSSIWRRIDSYEGRGSLEAWSYSFCRRALSAHLRKGERRPNHLALNEALDSGEREEESEELERVRAALEKLGGRQRAVVRLRHFEHVGFAEIARRLAVSVSTAKKDYATALVRLRELLSPHGKEVER